ncbi:hypothetical protein F5B20DRAFT_547387 [Whalleya microplaca]|nr:hypothetical protein F5B20DRAFT_547387 [Whalleya microplaca]
MGESFCLAGRRSAPWQIPITPVNSSLLLLRGAVAAGCAGLSSTIKEPLKRFTSSIGSDLSWQDRYDDQPSRVKVVSRRMDRKTGS